MINTERITAVTNTDLLSLYGTILKIHGVSGITQLAATNPGEFTQATNNLTVLCNEPVKTFDFAATATAGTVYFIAAYDFKGFSVAGTAVETIGATVTNDASTLYTATLSGGDVTIAKIGL